MYYLPTCFSSAEVEELLKGISGWNFDIFALDAATGGTASRSM